MWLPILIGVLGTYSLHTGFSQEELIQRRFFMRLMQPRMEQQKSMSSPRIQTCSSSCCDDITSSVQKSTLSLEQVTAVEWSSCGPLHRPLAGLGLRHYLPFTLSVVWTSLRALLTRGSSPGGKYSKMPIKQPLMPYPNSEQEAYQ